jgi:hypothetical protein
MLHGLNSQHFFLSSIYLCPHPPRSICFDLLPVHTHKHHYHPLRPFSAFTNYTKHLYLLSALSPVYYINIHQSYLRQLEDSQLPKKQSYTVSQFQIHLSKNPHNLHHGCTYDARYDQPTALSWATTKPSSSSSPKVVVTSLPAAMKSRYTSERMQ